MWMRYSARVGVKQVIHAGICWYSVICVLLNKKIFPKFQSSIENKWIEEVQCSWLAHRAEQTSPNTRCINQQAKVHIFSLVPLGLFKSTQVFKGTYPLFLVQGYLGSHWTCQHDGLWWLKSNLASRTLRTIPWKYCCPCVIMELEKMTVPRVDAPKTA